MNGPATCFIVGIGGALYPQAIQRIYAANSATALRRSLLVMAFLPLTTALIALIVGIIGLAHSQVSMSPIRIPTRCSR